MPTRDEISRLVGFNRYRFKAAYWVNGCVGIKLSRAPGAFRCPRCGASILFYHDRVDRYLRDLDFGRLRTLLIVPQHRLDCGRCGRQRERLPFARPSARCTRRFERWLFRLTRDMTVKAVAELTGTDRKTVKDAEVRHIRGLLRKRNLEGITHLGIDEVAEHTGHRYLTLVSDLNAHRVIWVGVGRSRVTIRRFARWFGRDRLRRLRVVCIDMHDPYQAELAVQAPQAVIVYDRFHVMKQLNHAVDQIRRRVQSQIPAPDRRAIKNKRYVILKARENLSPKERVRLKELLAANEDISTAYLLKEDFRGWFSMVSRSAARAYLRDWIGKARESGIPELLDFIQLLQRRRRGIRNYFLHRVTNGLSEGFNNVVKTLKKDAYGFHDSAYFKLKILRKCGKIERAEPDS